MTIITIRVLRFLRQRYLRFKVGGTQILMIIMISYDPIIADTNHNKS